MKRSIPRSAAPVAAVVTLLLPQLTAPSPDPGFLVRGVPRPAGGPGSPIGGCSSQVAGGDPLAVAASVAAWVYCGIGPTTAVTPHGRQVLLSWSALELPSSPARVTTVALVDPRTTPVVAYAVVTGARAPGSHRVVLTLFRSSAGQWVVDDLTVVGN